MLAGPVISIESSSKRSRLIYQIFGRLDGIPVTRFMPDLVDLPDRPGVSVYQLHTARLTAEERERLLKHLMGKLYFSRSEAELYLDNPGIIIYAADDVTVSAPPVIGL